MTGHAALAAVLFACLGGAGLLYLAVDAGRRLAARRRYAPRHRAAP